MVSLSNVFTDAALHGQILVKDQTIISVDWQDVIKEEWRLWDW
jgi:hypothetical protein